MHRITRLALFAFVLLTPVLVFAQASPIPDPVVDPLGLLVTAIHSRAWPLVVAVVVGGAVAFLKQGYLGQQLAQACPPALRPWLALVLSALAMWGSEVQTGIPWLQAAQDACVAALTAILGHQALVEHVRNGKELLPKSGGPLVPPGVQTLALVAFLGAGAASSLAAVMLPGCARAVPVVGPTTACVSSVVTLALQGMTLEQIVAQAGPDCVQSVEQVITILLNSGVNAPAVRQTRAYAQAYARRASVGR